MNESRHQQVVMKQTREILASSEFVRMRATARFVMASSQIASDLSSLLERTEQIGPPFSDETMDCLRKMETVIKDTYRDCFGAELGAHAEPEEELPDQFFEVAERGGTFYATVPALFNQEVFHSNNKQEVEDKLDWYERLLLAFLRWWKVQSARQQ